MDMGFGAPRNDTNECTLKIMHFQFTLFIANHTCTWHHLPLNLQSKSRGKWVVILTIILLHEKFLQFDWLRAVQVFQLNLKYLHVKIINL